MVTPAERPRIEAMWVVHLMLTLAALYAVIIAGMFFAQTWLLFPTMVAGSARAWLRRERLERRGDGPYPACALSSSQGRRVSLPRLCAQHRQAERAGAVLGLAHNPRSPSADTRRRGRHSGRLQHRRCGRRLSRPTSACCGANPGHAFRLARGGGP